jgi:hypothetical protein
MEAREEFQKRDDSPSLCWCCWPSLAEWVARLAEWVAIDRSKPEERRFRSMRVGLAQAPQAMPEEAPSAFFGS